MIKQNSDLEYVKSLLEGGSEAWIRFYLKNRKKIASYLFSKYPELTTADIEEVCDDVQIRLTKNNYKALRQYRGECSFEAYIITAINWAVKDWFKSNSLRLMQIPFDEAIDSEMNFHVNGSFSNGNEASSRIKSLPDDLRQAFLLRYYDDFGFSPEEIRLLAKRTGRHAKEITEIIIMCFSPEGENLLIRRRIEKQAIEESLRRCSSNISSLKRIEEKLYEKMDLCADKKVQKKLESELHAISVKIKSLEKRREISKKKIYTPTKTPYEIIAKILNIDSVSTIRSWVKKAKELLAKSLKSKPMKMSL